MGEKINADTTFDTKPYTKLKEKKLENIDYSVLS